MTDTNTDTKVTKLEEQVQHLLDKITQLENQLNSLQESFDELTDKYNNHVHCSGPYEYTDTPVDERYRGRAVCWTP